jgi:hypothetical protein
LSEPTYQGPFLVNDSSNNDSDNTFSYSTLILVITLPVVICVCIPFILYITYLGQKKRLTERNLRLWQQADKVGNFARRGTIQNTPRDDEYFFGSTSLAALYYQDSNEYRMYGDVGGTIVSGDNFNHSTNNHVRNSLKRFQYTLQENRRMNSMRVDSQRIWPEYKTDEESAIDVSYDSVMASIVERQSIPRRI